MREKLLLIGFFIGAFGFYAYHVAPSVTAGDSGEFMTAASTLSLAHAPSYPLYAIVARCWSEIIPWGSLGYRFNLFSAFTASLTLLFVILISRKKGANLLFSILLAVLIGTSASLWMNSLVTEVFSLHMLIAVLLLWILVNAETKQEYFYLFLFVLGLGLGNHHTLILLFVPFLVFWMRSTYQEQLIQKIILGVLLGVIGFSIYLFLPIRAQKEPPFNWGQPTTMNKVLRTITRKDYGSFTLALGEAPARNSTNTWLHVKRFGRQLSREVFWVFFLLAIVGLVVGMRRRDSFSFSLMMLFLLSGPLFAILGNLPFDAQSEGIMGRFFIVPVIALLLGLIELSTLRKAVTIPVLIIGCVLTFSNSRVLASSHRGGTLVYDYGNAILRTMTPNSILFMDGGDDAFYSLAYLHYGLGKRPDLLFHDRGGVVYQNIYGDDFRRLTSEQKSTRRHDVEKQNLENRNVFYSTMDPDVLSGVKLKHVGFLIEAQKFTSEPRASWGILVLRSLYPLNPNDYRTRALGAFFPFVWGQELVLGGNLTKGIQALERAFDMGRDVGWLKANLSALCLQQGYRFLMAGKYSEAEVLYSFLLSTDPLNEQANANLGAAYERNGKIAQAKAQYMKTAHMFPSAVDPVFNLSVMYWHEQDWSNVVRSLEEVLRRNPNHPSARNYLSQAKAKMGISK